MRWKPFIRENAMHLSWVVATTATLGSLYFSEIMHYEPCRLCWFQRILMYPLVIILAIAAIRKERHLYHYVLPMSIWGGGISLYHYLMQKTELFKSGATACGLVPCDVDYINWLDFITIPFLALIAFTLITIIQLLLWAADRD
ncbi:disulfide oxidoreductase [Paenibacillus mucilaginosus]|jgi:disulfide bond formation protein DsbB|uniref:Dihydroneopterin aldolase n=2 Tax=Paenibacillus mucilaginosus TaxID=61624 RepID=I0BEZ3_9BACL|nr:disulfide oxidoreductase [Paenibacillus mucilaginosus]AEI40115.1 disulfide bond formation protein DsbB [Paenibacillus mucilaginosus KNP414]AFH60940.1 dihydroneopterin aldolase [Paenibacillus mucilaginosus K02]MCG7215718.1 disulfide oxidoreductase [Paenibacillus mucilaginosus]WDM29349.1 disulfide bond formation protein B [Paenibacillus mucilaginosus]